MGKLKVIKVEPEIIKFENGWELYSDHDQDCCEEHYLSFRDLTIKDFDGLEFNLSNDNFFNRVEGYGIELIPIEGHPIRVPGYGVNNGYYSSKLDLVIVGPNFTKTYNIDNCQDY